MAGAAPAIAHDLRLLALRHPNVVPLLVTRLLSTPLGLRPLGTLRPLEQILSLLIDAGFAPADGLHVYRAYYGFLYVHILDELQEFIEIRTKTKRCPALAFTSQHPSSAKKPPPSIDRDTAKLP